MSSVSWWLGSAGQRAIDDTVTGTPDVMVAGLVHVNWVGGGGLAAEAAAVPDMSARAPLIPTTVTTDRIRIRLSFRRRASSLRRLRVLQVARQSPKSFFCTPPSRNRVSPA